MAGVAVGYSRPDTISQGCGVEVSLWGMVWPMNMQTTIYGLSIGSFLSEVWRNFNDIQSSYNEERGGECTLLSLRSRTTYILLYGNIGQTCCSNQNLVATSGSFLSYMYM